MLHRFTDFLDKPIASLGSTGFLAFAAKASESAADKGSLVATVTALFACVTAGFIALYWAHKVFLIAVGYYLRWTSGKKLIPVSRDEDETDEDAP